MVEALELRRQPGSTELENTVALAFLDESGRRPPAPGEKQQAADEKSKDESKTSGSDKAASNNSAPADKHKTTKAGEMLKEATDGFDKATDKKQAAKDLAAKFEGAIKQADDDYTKVEKKAAADLKASMPAIEKAAEAVMTEFQKVGGELLKAGLTPKQIQDIGPKLEKYTKLDDKDPAFAGIAKDLGAYPDLFKAAQSARTVFQQHKPTIEKFESTIGDLLQSANDRIRTRGVYSDTLKKAGDTQKSKEYEDAADKLKKELSDHVRKLMSGN